MDYRYVWKVGSFSSVLILVFSIIGCVAQPDEPSAEVSRDALESIEGWRASSHGMTISTPRLYKRSSFVQPEEEWLVSYEAVDGNNYLESKVGIIFTVNMKGGFFPLGGEGGSITFVDFGSGTNMVTDDGAILIEEKNGGEYVVKMHIGEEGGEHYVRGVVRVNPEKDPEAN